MQLSYNWSLPRTSAGSLWSLGTKCLPGASCHWPHWVSMLVNMEVCIPSGSSWPMCTWRGPCQISHERHLIPGGRSHSAEIAAGAAHCALSEYPDPCRALEHFWCHQIIKQTQILSPSKLWLRWLTAHGLEEGVSRRTALALPILWLLCYHHVFASHSSVYLILN
jgi:hypothetical protein